MGNIIVGLDLGTSNVRTVIGEITEDNKIEINTIEKLKYEA